MNRLAAGLLAVGLLVSGCSSTPDPGGPPSVATPSGPAPSTGAAPSAATPVDLRNDPYAALARELHSRGVGVWFDSDLVARWLDGPAAFQTAVHRLAALARLPGVQGFKVADELGYHDGIDSPAQATAFLRAVHDAFDRELPAGTPVLVDIVVPELGCLAWLPGASSSCAPGARAGAPAATETAVSGYLHAGLIDRLDLSTSLLDPATYASHGLTLADAQTAAWKHVVSLGWGGLTRLQARKALADVGGYQGSATDAAADTRTYVDIPTAAGARAVDIWTWRQVYEGHTVGLLAADLHDNPLWLALEARHRAGVTLFTHMTPSLLPPDRAARNREYAKVAGVFDDVFVAAGTG